MSWDWGKIYSWWLGRCCPCMVDLLSLISRRWRPLSLPPFVGNGCAARHVTHAAHCHPKCSPPATVHDLPWTTSAVAIEDGLEADLLPWTEMGSTPSPLLQLAPWDDDDLLPLVTAFAAMDGDGGGAAVQDEISSSICSPAHRPIRSPWEILTPLLPLTSIAARAAPPAALPSPLPWIWGRRWSTEFWCSGGLEGDGNEYDLGPLNKATLGGGGHGLGADVVGDNVIELSDGSGKAKPDFSVGLMVVDTLDKCKHVNFCGEARYLTSFIIEGGDVIL
ncbi:hypothetical protein ACLOJK_027122 [Asimina triloba]